MSTTKLMKLEEMVTWHGVVEMRPDEEETVLINVADGTVGEGFLEGGEWYWANGFTAEDVVYWAEMPLGLTAPVPFTPNGS